VTMAAGIAALANLDPEAIAHLNRLGDRRKISFACAASAVICQVCGGNPVLASATAARS